MNSTQIIQMLVGSALLLFGRKLFVLFLGAAGFLLGYGMGQELFADMRSEYLLVGAIVLGVFGMVLALFAQKIAIWVGGLLGGGLIGYEAGLTFGLANQPMLWVVVAICAIAGMLAMAALFEIALVLVTAFVGAAMIISPFGLATMLHAGLTIVLTIIGAAVQFSLVSKSPVPGQLSRRSRNSR